MDEEHIKEIFLGVNPGSDIQITINSHVKIIIIKKKFKNQKIFFTELYKSIGIFKNEYRDITIDVEISLTDIKN